MGTGESPSSSIPSQKMGGRNKYFLFMHFAVVVIIGHGISLESNRASLILKKRLSIKGISFSLRSPVPTMQ
jgi:hypothetical protein